MTAPLVLSNDMIERYSRQILLPGIGGVGQKKLLCSRVLVVGVGGLGAPAALYLAAAGVGTLGLMDSDEVDLSNLQRQVLHFTPDVGRPKVESAAEKLRALNPDVQVVTYRERFRPDNALDILEGFDFVLDATDSFPSKFLIADACHFGGKPYCHAGILRFEGQALTVFPGETACYRCVFHEPPPDGAVPTCSEAGVLGAVAGLLGVIQAAEALKALIGAGDLLTDRLLVCDVLRMGFRTVRVRRNPRCPLCGPEPTITHLDAAAVERPNGAACSVGAAKRDVDGLA